MKIRLPSLVAAVIVVCALAAPVRAQEAQPPRQQVISANPFGLLLEFFNAEYERAVSESATMGIGGSYASYDDDLTEGDDSYLNTDVFVRYYPQGRVFDGWNFGAKAGLTRLDSGTYPGFGFDANRSWLLGRDENFYVGIGFGLKRLIGDVGPGEIDVIPTIRIVNVGFRF
jgi:hypothetical protein